MKRLAKVLGYLGVGLLMFLGLAFLILQTPLFRNWLRGQIEQRASSFLQAELRIGRLQGSLFGGVVLSEVSLSQEDSLLFAARELAVQYDLTALLRHRIQVHTLLLDRPRVIVDRGKDGRLRLARLLGSADAGPAPAERQAGPSWRINISRLAVQQGRVDVLLQSRPPYIPARLEPLDLSASLTLVGDTLRARLRQLSLVSHDPDLRLRFFPFRVEMAPESLALSDLKVRTDSSEVSMAARVLDSKQPRLNVSLHTRPLTFSDVVKLLPAFPLRGKATADLEVTGSLSRLRVRTDIRSAAGRIRMQAVLGIESPPYHYQVSGRLDSLNVGRLLARPEWNSDLNLLFEVRGRGTTLPEAAVDTRLSFFGSALAGRRIESGRFEAALQNDSLHVESEVTSAAGNAFLVVTASHLLEERRVQAALSTEGLNLGPVLGIDSLQTSLSGRLQVSGRLPAGAGFSGNLDLDLSQSRFGPLAIDDLVLQTRLTPGTVDVDTLSLRVGADLLSAEGRLSRIDPSDFAFFADLPDLRPLRPWLWSDSAQAAAHLQGKVSGRLDTARVAGEYQMEDYGDGTLSVRYLQGDYSIRLREGDFIARLDGDAVGIEVAGLAVDEVRAHIEGGGQRWDMQLDGALFGEDRFRITGTLVPSDTTLLRLRGLEANINGQHWTKGPEPTDVRFWDDVVTLSQLDLSAGEQTIRLRGRLSATGEEDFEFSVAHLRIEPILQALVGDGGVRGTTNVAFRLRGAADDPRLAGEVLFRQGNLADFSFDSVWVALDYQQKSLGWNLRVVKDTSQVLTSTGSLPVDLALSAKGPRILRRPMRVYINTGGMDLSFLQAFLERVEDVEGRFAAHIVLENTPYQPRGRGPITVYSGAFTVPDYGIRIRNVAVRAQLNGTKVDIRQFKLESGPGRIEGTGALSLSREGLNQFALDLHASDFEIMHNDTMRARVNGRLRVTGSLQEPRVEGELTLAKTTIFLEGFEQEPALRAMSSRTTSPLFSLGVDTLVVRREEVSRKAEKPKVQEVRRTIGPRFDFYERLRGRIKVHIPRNTWVRSSAANFEITGTLELVKDGPEFVLFGPVEIVRGTYEVAGSRFQITEGRIVFQGEEDYNAQVKIVAEYRFTTYRDQERETRVLKLEIEGTAYQPKLTFYLGDQQIEEKDFLAYLFFGQPFDALLSGEQSTLSQATLSQRATSLFGGLLAQELGKALGQAFRLDIVEIRRQGAQLEQTTVSVGKYVAPNLFLSLSQDFAGGRRVAIEYEVFRKFFIQMLREQLGRQQQDRTAFDVIWKIDW